MGKTKTAVISGMADDTKSSEQKLREKREKQAEEKREVAIKKAKEKKKTEDRDKQKVEKAGLKGGERIKTVEAGPIIEDEEKEEETKVKRERIEKIRGKKYKEALSKVNKEKLYKTEDAISLVKETSISSFDGSVELHLVVKKKGTAVNINLPHSTGKTKKVEIASEKTIEKLESGKIDFDVLLTTPEMMPKLVKFARILGPKGLMPNPKNGTIIKTKADAKKFSTDTLTIKTEKKAPVIHTVIGKVSLADKKIKENLDEIVKKIGRKQIVKAVITSTMGPGIKLKI